MGNLEILDPQESLDKGALEEIKEEMVIQVLKETLV